MVSRILSLLNRRFSGIHEAAIVLAGSSLVSQVLALVRDRLFAHTFGASTTLDIYYASFRLPDYIFATIASLVSVTVLLPFLVRYIDGGQIKGAKRLLDGVFTIFTIAMIVVGIVAFFALPYLAKYLAPGFSGVELEQYITFARILLLSPILLGLSNVVASVTQTFQKFFIYAMSPVLYNIGIIFGVLFLYPKLGPTGLVWGVVLGALMHLLIQLPALSKINFLPRFTGRINFAEIRSIIKFSLPRTITLSAHSLVIIVLTALASRMTDGSISIFNFSFNLQSVPLAIIGVSYSVAAFPALAKLFSRGEHKKFISQISEATRHIVFWSIPVMTLFIVLRAQIVRVILGSGAFGWAETRLTAAALAIFSISVVAQSLNLLFIRGYYASGNTKTPLLINVSSSILIIFFAFLFSTLISRDGMAIALFERAFRVEGVLGTEVLLLPFVFTIGMILNTVFFLYVFQKDFDSFMVKIKRTFWQTLGASLVMGVVTYQLLNVFDNFLNINRFWGIFTQGLLSGLIGIFVACLFLRLLGNREIFDIYQAFRRRFWKSRPVLPSPDELG